MQPTGLPNSLISFLYRYQRHWFIPHCGLCHSAFHACCVMCNQSAHIFAYILNALKPSCAKLRYLGTNCKFFGPKVKSTCTSLQKSQYLDGNIKYQGIITCWAYWSVSSYVFRSIKLKPCLLNQNNAIKQQDILVFLLNINCLQYMKFVNNHKIQMVYFSYRSRIVLVSFSYRSRIVLVRFSIGSRSFSFGIGSRSFSFGSRSVLDRFSIGSRSSFVHPPFILRSFSVRSPFVLRSFSVHSPFILRSFSVRESENERRTKRDVTTTHRCWNEGTAKHKQETNNPEA